MIAKSINIIGIPLGYFLDLLDISTPHKYADCKLLILVRVLLFLVYDS